MSVVPTEQKKSLREQMKIKREAVSRATPHAAEAARNLFLEQIDLLSHWTISAYIAINSELDPAALMKALWSKGHPLALPVIIGKQAPLLFRRYKPGDILTKRAMDLMEPPETAEKAIPDLLIVPLLAFDRMGGRLGYGGGYYDRTIRTLRSEGKTCIAIGFAYAAQEIDEVPTDAHDVRLDGILTEKELILPRPLSDTNHLSRKLSV